MVTQEERNEKCADCGHSRENHDGSGCLVWINADAHNKCLCKLFKKIEEAP